MPVYDLGDAVPLEHEVRTADGVLTNATVTLTLVRPDGTTFPAPGISNPAVGHYRANPVPDVAGDVWAGAWITDGSVISVTPFAFSVADPAPTAYSDLIAVKSMLGKITDDDRDDLIQQAIVAASRQIDRRCGRRFYAERVVSARTFPVAGRTTCVGRRLLLMVDDIASATGVSVTFASVPGGTYSPVTDIDLGPYNAITLGEPLTEIWLNSLWLPPTALVKVTARWGWPAVPDEIVSATQLLAARLYRRKDSPQGVLGSSEWGVTRVSRVDPDVEALISPYVILAIA